MVAEAEPDPLFDARAATYDESTFHRELAAEVARRVASAAGDVLDVGTGTGLALRALGGREDVRSMSGVDVSERMLEVARAKLVGATLVSASAERLPFPAAAFDTVLCVSVLPYVNADRAAAEWGRVLRRAGQVVITAHEADGVTSSRTFRQAAKDVGIDMADPNAPTGTMEALQRLATLAGVRLAHVDHVVHRAPARLTGESFETQWRYFGSTLRLGEEHRQQWKERFLHLAHGIDEEEQRILIARFTR